MIILSVEASKPVSECAEVSRKTHAISHHLFQGCRFTKMIGRAQGQIQESPRDGNSISRAPCGGPHLFTNVVFVRNSPASFFRAPFIFCCCKDDRKGKGLTRGPLRFSYLTEGPSKLPKGTWVRGRFPLRHGSRMDPDLSRGPLSVW